MTYSNLTKKVMLAHSNNYQKGRNGKKICKITPHHAVCVCSGERIAQLFQDPNRYASANYCIGNDGGIVCNVYEEDRAYTSSNRNNDEQAITIEIANSSLGGDYPISDKAWKSLVALCVDICKRYDFTLKYDGTANGSLTEHRFFAATECPGNYIHSRLNKLAEEVNAQLKPKLDIKPIDTKKVKVIRDTNLWNLDFSDITKAQSVKPIAKDTVIEEVSAIATHECGSKYYMTLYSYSYNIHNGINVLDCEDMVETKNDVDEENLEVPIIEPDKAKNILVLLVELLAKIVTALFGGKNE